MPIQTAFDQVTIAARLHIVDAMQVAWPNPASPSDLRTEVISTYRAGDDPRTLEFSLDQVLAICNDQATQHSQVAIRINFIPLVQQDIGQCCQKQIVISSVEQGAQLVLTFQPQRDGDELVSQEEALTFANQLIDALHIRM